MEEKVALYEAQRSRLRARLVELRREQRRMNWFGLAALAAAAIARIWGFGPMIFVAIFGGSLFFVGHYIVYMHIHESKLSLAQIRAVIGGIGRGTSVHSARNGPPIAESLRAPRP